MEWSTFCCKYGKMSFEISINQEVKWSDLDLNIIKGRFNEN